MVTIYNGNALVKGDLIPGTALKFVQSVSKRRAEFECACGKTKVYQLWDLEHGFRKSCGCRCHKRLYIRDHGTLRHVNTLGTFLQPQMSFAVDLDSIDIFRELEILGVSKEVLDAWQN